MGYKEVPYFAAFSFYNAIYMYIHKSTGKPWVDLPFFFPTSSFNSIFRRMRGGLCLSLAPCVLVSLTLSYSKHGGGEGSAPFQTAVEKGLKSPLGSDSSPARPLSTYVLVFLTKVLLESRCQIITLEKILICQIKSSHSDKGLCCKFVYDDCHTTGMLAIMSRE